MYFGSNCDAFPPSQFAPLVAIFVVGVIDLATGAGTLIPVVTILRTPKAVRNDSSARNIRNHPASRA
jgi:hypothetical protein